MSSPNSAYTGQGFYAQQGGNAGNAQTFVGSYEPSLYLAHTIDQAASINQAYFNEGQETIQTTSNPQDPLYYTGHPVSWDTSRIDPLLSAQPSDPQNTPNPPNALEDLMSSIYKYSSPSAYMAHSFVTGGPQAASGAALNLWLGPVVIVFGLILLSIAAYSIVIPKEARSNIASAFVKSKLL